MATASNGTTASDGASSAKTPAQLMQEQHEAAETHRPTVEDTVDEDDIEHPPPVHAPVKVKENVPAPTNGVMSAKAAGKQKAVEKLGVLDTQDEEAFPSLGPASKPTAGAPPRLSGWAASASKASKQNGTTPASRPTSSGVPTPSSTPGVVTPNSSAAGQRAGVILPGRHVDSFEISNAEVDKTKPIKRVLDDVKKRFNVIVTHKPTNFGTRTSFIAEGPKARVTDALMYISKELTVETQAKLEIPSSASAQIIGRGGANIKKLETQFNVRIRIDRDKREIAGVDDVRTDVVEIKGHAAQVRQVEANITNQVRELQPKVDVPVHNIPPEFFPFLAGRHGSRLQQTHGDDVRIRIPDYYTWQQQPPPRAAEPGQGPRFVPHGDSHIIVSGDQAKARQARQELERLADQLEQELALEELACEQILHPYIVGDRGMDPIEFLQQTGCSVVVPPSHHDSEDIHIIGPKDRLEEGRNLAERLMSEKHNRAVDLNKHFQDAPQGPQGHSRALAQYLQKKAIQREFRNSHSAEIVFPTNASASPSWNIITSDAQKALSARNELSKITQAYPTSRLTLVEVDPFFHPHLEELHASHFNESLGVHMIIPDIGEDPVVLVYEGPSSGTPFSIPRSRPSAADITEFEKALQEAQALLLGSIPQQAMSIDDFPVPRKFHDKVRRFVNNEPKPRPPESFPVQLEFGAQQRRAPQAASNRSPDRVYLRGPSEEDIAALRSKIEEFLAEAEQDEKERGHVTTFDFPAQYNKNLIGRQGAHINQLRDKHDVQIDTKEIGKVKIQGPQKKAEACRAEILKLLKGWEDEVNFTIKIDPKYHGMLVGKSGENLLKIQSKVNNDVRIDFPRVSRIADDASIADTASDVGGRPSQAADEIKIRGPRAKAEKVKDELLSLKQYLEDNSHTATVSVAQAQVASLIGRRGAEMERLRAETGAQIDIPKSDGSERVTIQIKGSKQQVEKAKLELQKRSKTFDSIFTRTLEVEKKHHRALIGTGGANIASIVNKAGGTEGNKHVQFPQAGDDSSSLTIKGPKDVVEKIIAAIELSISERDSQVSELLDVPVNQHRNLIGTGGNIRKKLEDDFKVLINVPKQGSGQTGVKISGLPANVAKAKEHISGMAAGQPGETIMVPRKLHNVVARNGFTFGELTRMGVRVDHSGQKPPAKAATTGRKTNVDMPLITDHSGEGSHSWEVVHAENGEAGEIPWVLSAQKSAQQDALEKAKARIQELLESTSEPPVTGYLILSDPTLHRRIIGKGGSTINGIRESSGADIQVPKSGRGGAEEGEAIVITGTEDGVISAKDLILEELKRSGSSA